MKTVSQLLAGKNHRIETIAPNVHVFDALKLMLEKDIGSLLVVEFGKLVGIFTERDAVFRVLARGLPADSSERAIVSEKRDHSPASACVSSTPIPGITLARMSLSCSSIAMQAKLPGSNGAPLIFW